MNSHRRGLKPLLLTIAAAPLVVATLAGCGNSLPVGDNSEFSRQAATGDTWQVGVQHPDGDIGDCGDDVAVAEGIMSLDAPSSRYMWTLTPESDETDAERIADCLELGLADGTITIYEPVE